MLLGVGFVVVLQCLSASAQVYFSQPLGGDVIMGGVPFIVSVYDSLSVPYFGQMENFSLLFLTGTYHSPFTLYAWNLSSTNPSSVSTSISFPRTIAPNATNAYFLGIQGYLISNTSISTTYYSSLFTLQNMTGASSLLPSTPSSTSIQTSTFTFSSTTVTSSVTPTPGRAISCLSFSGLETQGEIGGNAGIIDQKCESAALTAFALLATQTRTLTADPAPLITTPPAYPQYTALLAEATGSQLSTSTIFSATPTPTSGDNGVGPATSTSAADSSSETAKMTYMLIIAGITLLTVVLLFWIWAHYRRNRQPQTPPQYSPCTHTSPSCECSRLRKMYDGVVTESKFLRLGKSDEGDPEKGLANQGARPGTSGLLSNSSRPASSRDDGGSSPTTTEEKRRRFEDEYRRRRASQMTVLAELEGDLGPFGEEAGDIVPSMPDEGVLFVREGEGEEERVIRTRNSTFSVSSRRKTMVGEGKSGVVVSGKVAANIVEVRRKGVGTEIVGNVKGRIEGGAEVEFPDVMEHILVREGEGEGEGEEVEDDEVKGNAEHVENNDADTIKPVEQAKSSNIRKERRRRKREELAKGGGSRDITVTREVTVIIL